METMDFDLKFYLNEKRGQVDAALQRLLDRCAESGRLTDAMRYSLMAGGKRLRPVLCLAGAGAVGGGNNNILSAACALEMIHTYSLIHDDLPAMDDDDLRRGKPTCHKAFDEATAVLAGDALLTLAFDVLAETALSDTDNSLKWLRVIRDIAGAAGCRGMVEGQMRDMEAEENPPDLDGLAQIHALKTGAMIEVSVVTGAVLAGGTGTQVEALRTYARHIGLAFQVADDILNVEGDPEIMGKAAGTDQTRHKSTYPSLMGLASSRKFAEELISQALTALNGFDAAADPLRAVATYIIQRRR